MKGTNKIKSQIMVNINKIRERIAYISCGAGDMAPTWREMKKSQQRTPSSILSGYSYSSSGSSDNVQSGSSGGRLVPVLVAKGGKPVLKWLTSRKDRRGSNSAWANRTMESDVTRGRFYRPDDTMSIHSVTSADFRQDDVDIMESDNDSYKDDDDKNEEEEEEEEFVEVVWDEDFVAGRRSWPYILPEVAPFGSYLPYSPLPPEESAACRLDGRMFYQLPVSRASDMDIVLEEYTGEDPLRPYYEYKWEYDRDSIEWNSEEEEEEEEEKYKYNMEEDVVEKLKAGSFWRRIKKFFICY